MIKFYAFFQSFLTEARESEKGQTMAEYAVVLAVITVAIVGTLGVPRRWHQQHPEQRHLQALSRETTLARAPEPTEHGARLGHEAPLRRGLSCFSAGHRSSVRMERRDHPFGGPIPQTGDGVRPLHARE